jgi:hypothetical protein
MKIPFFITFFVRRTTMFRTIFSFPAVLAALLLFPQFSFADTAKPAMMPDLPEHITKKFDGDAVPPSPNVPQAADVNSRIGSTYYTTYIRSPQVPTKAGEWIAFVCRVTFNNSEDVTIRVRGGCSILQKDSNSKHPITCSCVVFEPGTAAVKKDAQGNFEGFGDNVAGGARRGNRADLGDMYPARAGNDVYGEMTSLPTLQGQNSGNKAPQEKIFLRHFFLKSETGDSNGKFYDPSYGVIYTGAQNFQDMAVAAFCTAPAPVVGHTYWEPRSKNGRL